LTVASREQPWFRRMSQTAKSLAFGQTEMMRKAITTNVIAILMAV
jgi:hypothetical protein